MKGKKSAVSRKLKATQRGLDPVAHIAEGL